LSKFIESARGSTHLSYLTVFMVCNLHLVGFCLAKGCNEEALVDAHELGYKC